MPHAPPTGSPAGCRARPGRPAAPAGDRGGGEVAQVRCKKGASLAQHPVAETGPPGERPFLQVGSTELAQVARRLRVVMPTPGLIPRAGDILQPQPRSLAGTVACPPTARGGDPGEVCQQAGLVDAELPLPIVVGG